MRRRRIEDPVTGVQRATIDEMRTEAHTTG